MIGKSLKIGMLGLSPGNGHPYSWSTIFNGYDSVQMESSGFPAIANYLKRQQFPQDQIEGAVVSHIWTQDEELSHHIARTCYIETVVKDFRDMLGHVDAVILARDDYARHLEISAPFIDSGLPIFIDKPIAVSLGEANRIFSREKWRGQIFTCSALRFAQELYLTGEEREKVGNLIHIAGSTVKSWEKYAIHIIEPVISQFIGFSPDSRVENLRYDDFIQIAVKWNNGVCTTFQALGDKAKIGQISLSYYGDKGSVTKQFDNSFLAFKSALVKFLEAVRSQAVFIPQEETLQCVHLIEAGLKK